LTRYTIEFLNQNVFFSQKIHQKATIIMAFLQKASLFLFSIALFIGSVSAQEQPQQDISDADLKMFAAAFQEVQAVNQQLQNKMVGAIKEQGLDIQKFNEIQQASQSEGENSEVSEEDMAKYQQSVQAMQAVQQEAQQKMKASIEASGMELEKYQNIMRAVQEDPAMQGRLSELIAK